VVFRHQGKQLVLILGRVSDIDAKAKASQVDYLLMRLKQGDRSAGRGRDRRFRAA